ncbi:MAG: SDR family NAD(P)-dependent oxidoreductase [Brevundimonas sp.]|nr:MAG: SDR family NAD(P)-dependent oxidoreductase [Brevundimonas sp.]
MQTVLITGCSTGFGRETALEFLDKGWTVVATMRDPTASTLPAAGHLQVLPLDVTDPDSVAAAVAAAGPVDVLVNNAGIGWLNAVEGTPMETVRRVFDANLFGAIAMMQAVLPGMRARGSGAIVNVGSSSTYKPLPLLSVYRASKAALNALTESADLELAGDASGWSGRHCVGRRDLTGRTTTRRGIRRQPTDAKGDEGARSG